MNNQLIPVFAGEIAGSPVQLVDGRLLHGFLEVAARFNDWIAKRIEEYEFLDGTDFYSILSKTKGRPSKEYHLTLDMAKELSMVERNEKGKQARRYFIDCERIAQQSPTITPLPDPKTKKALPGGLTLEQQDTIKALVKANAEGLPKEKQAGAVIKQWAAIKQKFGCTYKEVSPDNFVNILSLLSRLPIEGELLPAPSVNNDLVEILTKRIKTLEGELMPKEPEQIPKLTGKCYIKTKIHLDADHLAEMMQEQGLMLVDAKEYTVVRRQEAH